MGALDRIDTWPAPTAASAVTVRRTPDSPKVSVTHGDIEHSFRIASITKPLSAFAMMIAVEEGSIDLDQPVSVPAPTGATMRHLLAHASGLPFDGREPIAALGERRIYSNTGIEIAAEEVASRTGIEFGTYLAEAVLDPLGMASTELKGSPAHGLWSTVADLTRFISELLEPTLIAATTWSEMTRIQYPELGGVVPGVGRFRPCPWGLGVEIHGDKSPHWMGRTNSPQTFGHFGGAGTMLWVDPIADVGLVALTDLPFDRWSDTAVRSWRELSDAVLAEVSE
jgi:CubicO group peptidase (beta-lactamase class C family)